MPSAKLKNQLHLHLLVFIAGFTAILGELITIDAISLVWYRMTMAGILMYIYILIKKINIKVSNKDLLNFFLAGLLIALHWITFFASIKVANISVALAMFSTGAFFASFVEPLLFKRKIIRYEILFGLLAIVGVYVIVQAELKFLNGIILGITSALFSTLFAVLNGTFIERHNATVISFYEFIFGVLCISVFLACYDSGFSASFFEISLSDFSYLAILASVCTAYAFIASVHVMRYISPYSVVLTYNLEPVYGIILAVLFFPESEVMGFPFYGGAVLIIITVLMNAIVKHKTQNLAHNNTHKT